MLNLITGVPGSGKTLNTIKMILDLQEESPDRPVYFFDIAECNVPGWQELTEEQSKDWETLPDSSIIFLDEGYKIFPQRGAKVEVPLYIQKLAEHRHRGFDFFIITQAPTNLDVFVRRLVGTHYHYDRRFGAKTVNRYLWNRIEEKPNDKFAQQQAVRESVKLDKKIFELYKSAEVHTHKRKYPPKLILAVVFFLSIPFLIWAGISNMNLPENNETVSESISTPNYDFLPNNNRPTQVSNNFDQYLPRIPGFPHTAPIYDEVTKPVTYPRYNCMHPTQNVNECKCYSQQATLLDVPVSICLSIMERGLFDHAREDPEPDRFIPVAALPDAHLRREPATPKRNAILIRQNTSQGNTGRLTP